METTNNNQHNQLKANNLGLHDKSLLVCTQVVDVDHPILGFFHGWLLEFAQHFGRIDVICLAEGKHDLPSHVHVHSLGKEAGAGKLRMLAQFYRLFWRHYQRQGVDYVFYHMGELYNILAAPFYLTRWLFHPRTQFYWWKTHGKLDLAGKLARHCSDGIFTAATRSFAAASDKVHVIGHAIDTQQFVPADHEPPAPLSLVVVGRVTPIKEVDVSIRCVAELKKRHHVATLSIIGPASDEKYRRELQAIIDTEGLVDQVTFVGAVNQTELATRYRQHQFLLNPATGAGLDKVILEAGLSGIIPLTSIPSCEPLLARYKLYLSENDPSQYAERIIELTASTNEMAFIKQQLRADIVRDHALSTLTKRIFGVR